MFDPVLFAALMSSTAAFTPLSLFAAGEQGAWYDPSDFTTMFTDAAGTTPVTAVEQPVGLLLDKSKGLALGAELVTNGDFSSNTWWTVAGGAAISSGALVFTSAIATSGAYRLSFATVGKYYEVTFEIVSISSGGIQIGLGDSKGTTRTAFGVHTQRILCTGNTNLTLYSVGASTTASVDNVSIKEVQGNHASQSTAASRPVLSARVNQLTYSEQLDNAVWNKAALNTTGTPSWVNVATAPDGTQTADKLIESNTTAQHYVSRVPTVTSGLTYTLSFYLKAEERTWAFLEFYGGIPAGNAYVNLSTGDKGTTTGSASAVTVTNAGGDWRRIELPGFVASSTTPAFAVYTSTGNGVNSYAGDGSSGIYIWGADLRVTNVGVNLPAYQRVGAAVTATTNPAVTGVPDYDTSGFPLYLKFDGVDDSLATGSIDPGSVDKAQVFAGVRKLSDAATAIPIELSASADANNGAFYIGAPGGAGASNYSAILRGNTTTNGYALTTYAAPSTNTLAIAFDIAGTTTATELPVANVNGASPTKTGIGGGTNSGTGNFGSYPVYLGGRGGTSFRYNGNLYSMILRFSAANLSDAQIASTETYVNSKTGAY